MKLTRDKMLEKIEQRKAVFEQRIPNNCYEVTIRGELSYPSYENEYTWITTAYFYKDKDVDDFIDDILSTHKVTRNKEQLNLLYTELTNLINSFINNYCEKYNTLPYDYPLQIITEDRYNMEKETEYCPVTIPFKIFITYNDNGKIYRVEK